jgi:hypothetical protein
VISRRKSARRLDRARIRWLHLAADLNKAAVGRPRHSQRCRLLRTPFPQHNGSRINARPGITSAGASAEWIVEGISADLPNFFEVTFGNVIAGTAHHTFILSPEGIVTNIGGQNGALTQGLIASANAHTRRLPRSVVHD